MQKPCACGCGQLTDNMFKRGHHSRLRKANGFHHKPVASSSTAPNPSGFCMCGCGQQTKRATSTVAGLGIIEGECLRYCLGHGNTKHRNKIQINGEGLCRCGCGQKTSIAKYTDLKRGVTKGQPLRWIHNHHQECYEPESSYTVEERGFETPCWIWQRWTNKDGYAFFTRKKRARLAHRYFYATYVAPIPPHTVIHHRCFNRNCVNPDHLKAVSALYNSQNRMDTVLTMEKAEVIRKLHEWGATRRQIAGIFRVSKPLIHAVVQGKIWKEGGE